MPDKRVTEIPRVHVQLSVFFTVCLRAMPYLVLPSFAYTCTRFEFLVRRWVLGGLITPASVAQLAEYWTGNPVVTGSNPI